ncbi:hypothetical protein [Streptomyces sp. MI02-7b]|uniref:hypothetical protein n=1 Tax=Streptomyces sp. MI02-7b TaxID=462941 RepID=UPI0029ABE209|nr:hypothetical protein [Streptomyces sp. MI02-7b]MDX3076729.1 hypothetical protein [Streptomyces sp. MI02-7b]
MLSMVPAAASAQSPAAGPTIAYTTSTHDANDAIALEVAVAPSTPVQSLTATITLQDGTAVGTIPAEAFHQVGTDARGNVLWLGTPSGLASAPMYFFRTDAVDAQGNHTTETTAFPYTDHVWFDDKVIEPNPRDWRHQSVTVSGKVTRIHPDGTLVEPLAGKRIFARTNSGSIGDAGTIVAEDGTYRITIPPSGQWYTTVQPCIYEDGVGFTDCEQLHNADAVVSNTRITMDESALSEVQGKSVAVSGRADYFDFTERAWKPLADVPVNTTVHDSRLTAHTDAKGHFSIKVSPPTDVRGGSVQVAGYNAPAPIGWYLNSSTARYTVDVHDRVTIGLTGASIGADGLLTLKGTAKTLSGGQGPKLAVQYSADNRTWTNAGAFYAPINGNFTYRKVHATPRGYWRVHYAGDTIFTAATSPVKHLVRTATRITTFNAAPEPVVAGRPITVSGNLQRQSGSKWAAFANQKVGIYFRVYGSSRLAPMGYAYTDSRGHFSKRFTAQWDGAWRAVFRTPSGAYLDTLSGFDTVYVDH